MGAVAEKEFRTWVRGGGKGNPAKRISEALALLEGGLGQLDDARPPQREEKMNDGGQFDLTDKVAVVTGGSRGLGPRDRAGVRRGGCRRRDRVQEARLRANRRQRRSRNRRGEGLSQSRAMSAGGTTATHSSTRHSTSSAASMCS